MSGIAAVDVASARWEQTKDGTIRATTSLENLSETATELKI